ncbi:SH3 domain-containing protein [Frigidibacter sp. MR17.24]|uniref:SH3 domain-containing protein n=1 Tax=Frigidibacter sp. MR17.24 TaxID=3127345 RepID=UPI0030131D0E
MRHHLFIALMCLGLSPTPVPAQPIETRPIDPAPAVTLEGRLAGPAITDYVFTAGPDEGVAISLAAGNAAAHFNLLRGDDPAALHIGSIAGETFAGALPGPGPYRVRVYLMRSAARRGETSGYRLTVTRIPPPPRASDGTPRDPDFADGLSGGPDWWQVTGLAPGGRLNLRAGPGSAQPVLAALAAGTRLANRGCRMVEATRWCRVALPGPPPREGWVAGRFLREAAP